MSELFGLFETTEHTPEEPKLERPYSPDDCLLEARFYDQFKDLADFENGEIHVPVDGFYWQIQRIEDGHAVRYGGDPVPIVATTMLLYSKNNWHGKPIPNLEKFDASK